MKYIKEKMIILMLLIQNLVKHIRIIYLLRFRVCAYNEVGKGDYSVISKFTTKPDKPLPVENIVLYY